MLPLAVAATLVGLSACGSSHTTTSTPVATLAPPPSQPAPAPEPKLKSKPKPPPAPSPSPRQVALQQTISCLQGIPLLHVETGGSLSDIDVHADVQTGGGNAMIVVFPTHAGAVKYSHTFNAGAVGNLDGLIWNYKGSQEFQAAVRGCLR